MTNRILRAGRSRTIALALLTVGLHLLGLLVVAPRLGGGSGGGVKPPPVMEARLIAAPPPPKPAAPTPTAPKPRPKAVPRTPKLPPPQIAAAPAPQSPVEAQLAEPAQLVEPQLAALPVDAGAAIKLTDVESLHVAVTPPAVATPPASLASEAIVGRAYRTDVPPSSRILLDVARKDADGTLWHGEAAMNWRLDGGQYKMKLEAGIRVLVTRVNLVVLESAGRIDAAGFVPRTMTEKRRGRAATATEFGADSKITFSASPATYAIVPGTQDKATVPLQLAAIARADSAQLKGNIDILVGEDKDASVFRFMLIGQEEIDTPIGRLATWHLSRPPRAGAYGSRLDVWLAPSLGWVPVRIDNIEASGAMTSQTVKNIGQADAG